MKPKNDNILLIDPLSDFNIENTAGVAYLRGFLTSNNIEVSVLNFNKTTDKKYKLLYKKSINNILQKSHICLPPEKLSKNNSIYFLLNSLYYFGPEFIWQAVDEIDIFKKLFSYYEKDFRSVEYIGISITYPEQLFFSLLLVDYLRKKNFNTKLIVGGSLVTLNLKDFIRLFSLKPLVDFIVTGEGETPLLKILNKEEPEKIPNLFYLKDGDYKRAKNLSHFEKIDSLPAPIFNPDDSVWLHYSRNCYWNKCSFCVVKNCNYNPKYTKRKIEQIAEDIKKNNLIRNKNDEMYYFADGALPFSFFTDFYDVIKKDKDIKNEFTCYLRFDSWIQEDILKLSKDSGFRYFLLGAETTVGRLQELIGKGCEVSQIWKVLNLCYEFNFELCLMFMIGLPTQTKKELELDLFNIKKILKKYPNVKKVRIHPLSIKTGTSIFKNPEKYGIEILNNTKIFLNDHYSFKQINSNAVSSQEAVNIAKKYIDSNLKQYKNKIFL